MIMFLWLFRLATMSPLHANYVAADGDPAILEFLTHVCRRESGGCHRIGIHKIDAWASRRVWRNAVRRGFINPEVCPFHAYGPGWSTRGPLGQMAGYSWPHLPTWLWCAPPSIFDIPWVSAMAAGNRARSICSKRRACTVRALDRVWGRGNEPEAAFEVQVSEAELRVIEAGVSLVARGSLTRQRRIARRLLAEMKTRVQRKETE